MKNYKYKFSVIIPVYNVEEYLEETLISVINQKIDFKDIQIILVNDGSPDNSEEICLKYKEKYPDNIIYVKQENAGVSAARNKGMEYVEGEYINFLDSDDKWDLDVFKKAYKMFIKNSNVDVIGVRQKSFEATENYLPLDFKFTSDKVVDIFENYDHIQLSVTSAFIKAEAIGNIRFDCKVKYSEDAKFLTEILIKNGKLGIIASSLHHYRKRLADNSAIQKKAYNDDWYLVTPKSCYKYLFDFSKKKYGYVLPYIQFYFVYDLQWRVRDIIPSDIKSSVLKKYKTMIKELLQDVDDNIIMEQRNIFSEYKMNILSFKYGYNISKKFKYDEHVLYFNDLPMVNLEKYGLLKIETMNFANGKIDLRGFFNTYLPQKDFYINLVVNNTKKYKLDLKKTEIYSRKFFNEEFISNLGFKIEIKEKDVKSLYFEIIYKKNYITQLNFANSVNSKLDSRTRIYYIYKNKIYYAHNRFIKTAKKTIFNRIKFCIRSTTNKIVKRKFKVLMYRIIYTMVKIFKRKKIWLVSDRTTVANDNGLHLFKYIVKQNNKNIEPYFVINKNTPDYKELKKIGKVIAYNSYKYKIYFLLADKIISSQADAWVYNAFGKHERYYRDLYNFDFVFLQHGITKDDISRWLNHYEKNIRLFITAANDEYNSIINGNYEYGKDVVKLTGFSRYDNLTSNPKKIIAIMPTWRSALSGKVNKSAGTRDYNPNFKDSEYFKFYNNLINDKKLLEIMNNNGYKGIFVIHPSHKENYIDFDGNNTFEIISGFADYQKIFKEANLLVSDYSSVPFDFAYLYKPVVYTQFDKEEFFSSHIYNSGYFDYVRDGFGPVTNNYADTVSAIVKYIETDCNLENKYRKRIEKFYKYTDKNNCKRIYEEILKLDNGKE